MPEGTDITVATRVRFELTWEIPNGLAPNMYTVKKLHAHETSSGCSSVPEPGSQQKVDKVRTECVDESDKKHMYPTVDETRHACQLRSQEKRGPQAEVMYGLADWRLGQWANFEYSQAVPVRPLFPVGSYVLAWTPQSQRSQPRNQRCL